MNLQQILLEALPHYLADHARVSSLEAGTLTVVAASGATAAKVRQLAQRLKEQFILKNLKVNEIRVVVQVDGFAAPNTSAQPKSLPEGAVHQLHKLAGDLPAGPLKSAVDRLLARQRKP